MSTSTSKAKRATARRELVLADLRLGLARLELRKKELKRVVSTVKDGMTPAQAWQWLADLDAFSIIDGDDDE